MKFTIEEMSLISTMNYTDRRMAIQDMESSIPGIKDRELKELCEKTLRKLYSISDEEFAAIDFAGCAEDKVPNDPASYLTIGSGGGAYEEQR